MRLFRRATLWIALAITAAAGCRRAPSGPVLGEPTPVAPGVVLYRTADDALVGHAGPIAVSLLKLDAKVVKLQSVLSTSEVMHAETVENVARRLGAIAAVNGGYFNRGNGEPVGLLKVGGELVSDTGALRGAVVIDTTADGRTRLVFDRLSARVYMTFTAGGAMRRVAISGVDTTRARGKMMLYTPKYHPDTDTAPTGTEWVLDGTPLHVIDVRANIGHTKIPPHGAVLSFGGTDLPEDLSVLTEDVVVAFETQWTSRAGLTAEFLNAATDIVSGAGLLRREGHVVSDWRDEGLSAEAFTSARHPRTLIGADRHGDIWLGTIDGRQPSYSIGMTFDDLQKLADRLDLVGALNLDGGGSTTMVVGGRIINRPSDSTGPRPVSDALIVMPR